MRKWLALALILVAVILVVYLWPTPRPSSQELYARAPADKVASLAAFRANIPVRRLPVKGVEWEYIATGAGAQTVLFLHGMTGSYDIWWQQVEDLRSRYRVVSVTYPAVNSLAEMEAGVMAILQQEGVTSFHLVGTSLGGYFGQYLIGRYPDRILSAVLANTFPPNDLILEKNGTLGSLIPYLPEWLVMNVLKGSFTSSIYPASGNDEMTLAFLNELVAGRVSRAQVAGRYQGVVEKFAPPTSTRVPILIIEADNDPLVEPALREQLKKTYPAARVVTVHNGHFPYIATPDAYTQQILAFFAGN